MHHRFEIQHTWHGELLPCAERGWLEVERRGSQLEMWWDAPCWQEPDPSLPPGECPELWQYQAIELFLGIPGQSKYLEFEFGPAGHWLALEFASYRYLEARITLRSYTWQRNAERWNGRASVDSPLVSGVGVGNAHLVHRCPHGRTHCSAHGDPNGPPDFHRSDLFLPLDAGSPGRV